MGQAWICPFTPNKNSLLALEKIFKNLGVSANVHGLLNQILSLQRIGLLHVEALGN